MRTNIKYGKRPKGGYIGEIDVAAFNPSGKRLLHIETSTDSHSWEERKQRFLKHFTKAQGRYREVFHFKIREIRHIAIVGFNTKKPDQAQFGNDIEVIMVPDFIQKIAQELRKHTPLEKAVPESYPLLRAIQYAVNYGKPPQKTS